MKTIKCYDCGMAIPKSAQVCHYCGAKQIDPFERFVRKIVKWSIIIAIIATAAFVAYFWNDL